jgi:hypothetical protein
MPTQGMQRQPARLPLHSPGSGHVQVSRPTCFRDLIFPRLHLPGCWIK